MSSVAIFVWHFKGKVLADCLSAASITPCDIEVVEAVDRQSANTFCAIDFM